MFNAAIIAEAQEIKPIPQHIEDIMQSLALEEEDMGVFEKAAVELGAEMLLVSAEVRGLGAHAIARLIERDTPVAIILLEKAGLTAAANTLRQATVNAHGWAKLN